MRGISNGTCPADYFPQNLGIWSQYTQRTGTSSLGSNLFTAIRALLTSLPPFTSCDPFQELPPMSFYSAAGLDHRHKRTRAPLPQLAPPPRPVTLPEILLGRDQPPDYRSLEIKKGLYQRLQKATEKRPFFLSSRASSERELTPIRSEQKSRHLPPAR
jgi:hypothetical protein